MLLNDTFPASGKGIDVVIDSPKIAHLFCRDASLKEVSLLSVAKRFNIDLIITDKKNSLTHLFEERIKVNEIVIFS
jgi:hypothetical protein